MSISTERNLPWAATECGWKKSKRRPRRNLSPNRKRRKKRQQRMNGKPTKTPRSWPSGTTTRKNKRHAEPNPAQADYHFRLPPNRHPGVLHGLVYAGDSCRIL